FAAISKAAGLGDKASYLVLSELARHLGQALAGVVNITGSTHVVVGGQLAAAGPTFLTDLASELRQRVMILLARNISVAYAALPAHAGAWGVAVQALETALADGTFLSGAKVAAHG